MSLKLNFASLSFGASVDQQTGALSVFEVIEEIRVPRIPAQLTSAVISLVLEKTGEGDFLGKFLIHVLTPDGKQQLLGQNELRIPNQQKRLKAVFRFGGFPLNDEGDYRFVVSWTDGGAEKIGEALLDFSVVQTPQVAQGVAPPSKPDLSH